MRAAVAVGVLVLVGASALAGGRVWAHATLISSTPAANSVVQESPTEIVLTFTEPVDLVPDAIRVLDDQGNPAPVGGAARAGGDETIAVPVEALADGTWVVAWQAISADSHPIRGAFTFSVGAPSAGDELLDTITLGETPTSADSWWLVAGRALSFAGVAGLAGVFTMVWWAIPDRFGSRAVELVLWAAVSVGVAGTLLMLAGQARLVSGAVFDPDAWATVASSRSGRWWLVRLIGLAVAIGLVAARSWLVRHRQVLGMVTLGWVALLGVVAAGGHAATGRAPEAAWAMTVVHLVAVAVWIGGLVAVVVAGREQRWSTAALVSPIALVAVLVLAVTGTANAIRQGVLDTGVTSTEYGRWLLVKLAIVAAVLATAIVSRVLVGGAQPPQPMRRAGRRSGRRTSAAAVPRPDREATTAVSAGLRRSVTVELVGILAVFAATGGLASSSPPLASASNGGPPVEARATERGVDAFVTVDPPVTGGTLMHVTLTSADPVWAQPDEIEVTARQDIAQVGPLEIPTVAATPQHVIAYDANFPIPGVWTIVVTARYGDFDQIVFSLEVEIG
ncbi:MAG TPA: copper resistance protein CopC [Ilumatobacter sp.]|nr:copper resistance protein CopC [Ilumatobacter sp.]